MIIITDIKELPTNCNEHDVRYRELICHKKFIYRKKSKEPTDDEDDELNDVNNKDHNKIIEKNFNIRQIQTDGGGNDFVNYDSADSCITNKFKPPSENKPTFKRRVDFYDKNLKNKYIVRHTNKKTIDKNKYG